MVHYGLSTFKKIKNLKQNHKGKINYFNCFTYLCTTCAQRSFCFSLDCYHAISYVWQVVHTFIYKEDTCICSKVSTMNNHDKHQMKNVSMFLCILIWHIQLLACLAHVWQLCAAVVNLDILASGNAHYNSYAGYSLKMAPHQSICRTNVSLSLSLSLSLFLSFSLSLSLSLPLSLNLNHIHLLFVSLLCTELCPRKVTVKKYTVLFKGPRQRSITFIYAPNSKD